MILFRDETINIKGKMAKWKDLFTLKLMVPSSSGSEPIAPPFNSFASTNTINKALTPNRQLGELLRTVDPKFCFQPAVEELLLNMASDFVQDVVEFSGKLAKHRRSITLEPRDLQFCLAKNYGISLAGVLPATATGGLLRPLGQDLLVRARPAKNSMHMHRMALKRNSQQNIKTKLKTAHAVKATENGKKVMRKASVTK
ncbi:putative transcription initiation factor TFIID subunit 12 domain, histone-fold protein [Plasmopara halstedii]